MRNPRVEESRSRGVGRRIGRFGSVVPALIIAAWLVFVVAAYFRLQLERVLEIAGAGR